MLSYCTLGHQPVPPEADVAADGLVFHSAFQNRFVFSRLNKVREDTLLAVFADCVRQGGRTVIDCRHMPGLQSGGHGTIANIPGVNFAP